MSTGPFLSAVLVALPSLAFAGGIPFEGHLIDRDGKPARDAVVQVERLADRPLSFLDLDRPAGKPPATHADGKGGFRIELPGPGAWRVWFRAPLHRGDSVIVMVPDAVKALPKITARLRTPPAAEWFGNPRVAIKGQGKALADMTAAPDGSWTYEGKAPSDDVLYTVVVQRKEGPDSVTNPADAVVFDTYGFYSVGRVTDGSLRIRFDPKSLNPRGQSEFSFTFSGGAAGVRRCAEIVDDFQMVQAELVRQTWSGPREKYKEVRDALMPPLAQKLAATARDAREPREARELAAVLALHASATMNDLPVDDLWTVISPASLGWSAYPPAHDGYVAVRFKDGATAEAYLRAVADQNPDRSVRAEAMLALAQRARDRKAGDADELMRKVSAEFSDVPVVEDFIRRQKRTPKLAAGATFPELGLKSLNGTVWDGAALHGHFTLVDFSATGCGACTRLIPELQKVRAEFAGEALRMVTITLGTTQETLPQLLAHEPEQAWEHVALPDSEDADRAMDLLGVTYYPTLFLVGPDGTIVATDDALKKNGETAKNVSSAIHGALPAAPADGGVDAGP